MSTRKALTIIIVLGLALAAAAVLLFGYCLPMRMATPIIEALQSEEKSVVLNAMDTIGKRELRGPGRKAVEEALARVLDHTDDLDYLRVGIIASDFHHGGSLRLADDPKKRAILEKAIERYNKAEIDEARSEQSSSYERWELDKQPNGSYLTINTHIMQ